MGRFDGYVALVTGANKGLGLEIARQLGREGIKVIVGARDLAKGEAAAAALKGEGLAARAVQLDVTKAADIAGAAAFVQKNYGRLDILVNNAGVSLDSEPGGDWMASTAGSISTDRLRRTFETNVFGAVALTQAVLPLLKASPAGRIVNQSSILGSLALHADPTSAVYSVKPFGYDASKAALNALSIHLAYELRDTKIKVNSAHPGWVKTDMGGAAAPLEVPEGAKTAVWLATLAEDGPTGGFFHGQERLPW